MNINTQNLVSITDANQNFPKAARLADKDVMAISKRLIEKIGKLMRNLPNDETFKTPNTSAA